MIKRFKTVSFMLFVMGLPVTAAYAETSPIETIEIVQQNGAASGIVVDANGEPLTGASVLVKGTTKGAMVDNDGKFSIPGVKAGQTLRITFIGYQPIEVKWEGQPLNVVLKEDDSALGEVVVTAMGIKKDAKKLGYSVSTVAAEELTKTASPNFASAMYGKAAGVRIQSAPGGGTSSVSINVRGLSSITGSTQPLIIMDGVPVRNGDANNTGDFWSSNADAQRIMSNGLVDINPEDIENISILKGAAASALYGSEAANGVVVITTKTGKGSKGIGVDFGVNESWDMVAYMPQQQTLYGPGTFGQRNNIDLYMVEHGGFYNEKIDGKEYHTAQNTYNYWGPKYDGSEVTYWDGSKRKYESMGANPWKDIFRTGFNQQYNLSLTKAGEFGNVRFGYTYNDVQAMQQNSFNNKHNFSLTGTINVLSNVTVEFSANYMRQHIQNRAYRLSRVLLNYGGLVGSFDDVALMHDKTVTSKGFMYRDQLQPSETPDESLLYTPATGSLMGEYFWNIMGTELLENNSRLIGGITPSWEIIPGLTLRGRIATDITAEDVESKSKAKRDLPFAENSNDKGAYGLTNRKYEIYYGDVMLMFDRTFKEKHNVTANVGWSGRDERTKASIVQTSGGLSVVNWFNLAASSLTSDNAKMEDISSLRTAVFATASYGYDNWGFLEGSVRQEKISTLAPGNNSFFYPSINASVIVSELLKDKCPEWLSYGKVRASYGIVGNAPSVYSANNLYTQSTVGTYLLNSIGGSLGNEGIKPETKHEFEIGIEGKFFHNRLGFEFSYYNNDVKDQILKSTLAQTAGGTSILLNIGELKNSGEEIAIYGTPVQTNDWRLDLRANLSFNKNKVVKLMDGVDRLDHFNGSKDNSVYLYSDVGRPMGDWYCYPYLRDDNGNKIIGTDGLPIRDTELKRVGNAMAKAVGGFSGSLSYKNWNLDFTMDFRIGGKVLNQYWTYAMETGHLKETLNGRDAEHGGLPYYYDNNLIGTDENGDKIAKVGNIIPGEAPAGFTQFNDGIIVEGVHEDGTKNETIVPAGQYYGNCFGWGANTHNSYEDAIQDNSYVKMRELSLGYSFPKAWTNKFGCTRLTLSTFARNPFYIYKALKEMDAESGDGTNWIWQSVAGNSSATSRSFGIALRASF